ncbi:MAG: hypothetical protein AAGA90_12900 [Actinomycetota bacterium]
MKRTFWTGVGYTLGIGTGWYVQRRVKHTVDRYAPEQVRADVADKSRQAVSRARDTVHDLRSAANEGIAAMRAEKADLLAEFANDEVLHTGPARAVQPRGRANRGYRPRHGSAPD